MNLALGIGIGIVVLILLIFIIAIGSLFLVKDNEKLKHILGFCKIIIVTLIGSTAVGVISAYINADIQRKSLELENTKEENRHLAQFISNALEKDLEKRHDFAEYFALVSRTDESRKRWQGYVSAINAKITESEEKIIAEDEFRKKRNEEIVSLQNRIKNIEKEHNQQISELQKALEAAKQNNNGPKIKELENTIAKLKESTIQVVARAAMELQAVKKEKEAAEKRIKQLEAKISSQAVTFNLPPIITVPESVQAGFGTNLTFFVVGSDPDNDPVIVSVQNLPPGSIFDGHTFIWTPRKEDVGVHRVTFVASDGIHATVKDVEIAVLSTNSPPSLQVKPE